MRITKNAQETTHLNDRDLTEAFINDYMPSEIARYSDSVVVQKLAESYDDMILEEDTKVQEAFMKQFYTTGNVSAKVMAYLEELIKYCHTYNIPQERLTHSIYEKLADLDAFIYGNQSLNFPLFMNGIKTL
jgi:hypothetical protein